MTPSVFLWQRRTKWKSENTYERKTPNAPCSLVVIPSCNGPPQGPAVRNVSLGGGGTGRSEIPFQTVEGKA